MFLGALRVLRLFSFHIPMLMRSCLSELVSQAQHLYLTVSKVVTVVSAVRKIFHLSLWKPGVRKPYSRYFPGSSAVAAGWRVTFLPCATEQCTFYHQSEEQDLKQVKRVTQKLQEWEKLESFLLPVMFTCRQWRLVWTCLCEAGERGTCYFLRNFHEIALLHGVSKCIMEMCGTGPVPT